MERLPAQGSAELPDRSRLTEALDRLGRGLASRGIFAELVVHAGGPTVFRLAWTLGGDLSVGILDFDGHLVPAAVEAAEGTDLDPSWLVTLVDLGPRDDAVFELAGTYPEGSAPGLRLVVSDARYLSAMQALSIEEGRT